MADYKTIRGTSTFEYEEKRSRFIATAAFADTEEKALAVLNAVRAANRTARHNVYAYVLQNGRTRYSDDGEPAKTAGTPVLETIGHAGVADVIVVVTRYFGGILLGTGGLVRAYTAAASGALQQAELVSMRLVVDCSVRVSYAQFEQAQRMAAEVGEVLYPEEDGEVEPGFPIAITSDGSGEITFDWSKMAGKLNPGTYYVRIGIRDNYDPEKIPANVTKRYSKQSYCVEFTVEP